MRRLAWWTVSTLTVFCLLIITPARAADPEMDKLLQGPVGKDWVTNGKSQMPAWGDLLKGDDIEALWAYVTVGEKK